MRHADIPARAVLFDVAVVGAAIVVAVVDTLTSQASMRAYGGVSTVVLSGLSLCLLYRRRAPLTVAWVGIGAGVVMSIVEAVEPGTLLRASPDPEAGPWLPPIAPFAAYSVAAFAGHRRAAWPALGALVACGLLMANVSGQPSGVPWFGQYTVSVMFLAVPALLGLYVGARRRLLEAALDRAERAEREQHLLAEQARADERARLAVEMHDTVSHRVSLMVLRAGALRVSAPDEATRVAAEDLRVTGCRALEELRDLVGLLREGGPEPQSVSESQTVPVPDLAPLVAESRAVGVDVELVEQGTAMLVSPIVGRAAYRIIQEALTNVRKHAAGARVCAEIRYTRDGVRLRVENTAPTTRGDAALAAAGSGSGLLGLRQRVELIGGVLDAGPTADGGFMVEATLPACVGVMA